MTPWDIISKVNLHPLVWVGLFMLFGPPMLLSKTAAKIPGWAGTISRWNQRRSDRMRGRPATISFDQQQVEITRLAAQYQELWAANAKLRADNAELWADNDDRDKRIDRIEADLTQEKRLRWSAISYIRELLDWGRKYSPGTPPPEPPPILNGIL